jgi:hypothetical protein
MGASVTGTSHQAVGRGCEDAHRWLVRTDGTLLAAVADGAGSAAEAATGSQLAVQTALDVLNQRLNQAPALASAADWQLCLTTALQTARTAIETASQSQPPTTTAQPGPEHLRRFATTLILAAVTADWLALAQVGDGYALWRSSDNHLQPLTQPDQDHYLNETVFLTDLDYLEQAHFSISPITNLTGLALLTDGPQLLAVNMANNYPHRPFFDPLFTFAARPEATEAELAAFLNSARVCARTDDDKTLVLAVKQDAYLSTC